MKKECYKCHSTKHVVLTSYENTVKFKSKLVTYQHEGHECTKCNRVYDEKPGQTEANKKRMQEAWETAPMQKRR